MSKSKFIPASMKLDREYQKALESKFNIIDVIETKEFDEDPKSLIPRLNLTKKLVFSPDDRYIIVLFDNCYYLDDKNLLIYNLMAIWEYLEIPFYTLMFYTNHFGLKKEIETYCKKLHQLDRPSVIETFYNPRNYYDDSESGIKDADIDQIEFSALCLMGGSQRSHRQASYANLKNISEEKLVLNISAPKNDSYIDKT